MVCRLVDCRIAFYFILLRWTFISPALAKRNLVRMKLVFLITQSGTDLFFRLFQDQRFGQF